MNSEPLFFRRVFPVLLLFGLQATAGAQNDTLLTLPPVDVLDVAPASTGLRAWSDDSIPVSALATAADRLRWEHAILVRANGPGLLATPSARGAGPARTAVLWNGLNLQSPMNGVYDLSLLPVWPGDRLELRFGGQSAAWSTGAMAGSLQLQQSAVAQSGPGGMLEASAGSFGSAGARGALDYGSDQLRGSLRAAWVQAENDFPFVNTTLIGAPRQRQPNNGMRRLDLQHVQEWDAGENSRLKSAVWWQSARREIPPAMTEAVPRSWQEDQALRAQVSWRHPINDRQQWEHQAAWLDESLAFHLNGQTDTSRSKTVLWRSEYRWTPVSGWQFRPGVQLVRQWARSDGYGDTSRWQRLTRLAAHAAVEKKVGGMRLSMLLRQEWAGYLGAPFTGSVGVQGPVFKRLQFRAQVSRNFNLPTFNDRYWQTLGNPDLVPEKGYGAEFGLLWETLSGTTAIRLESGLFHMLMDNWILWQPGSDGLFRPGNLRQVWSRGWESSLTLRQPLGHWQLSLRLHHQLSIATHTAVYDNQQQVLDKQLPYTPRHSGGLRVGATRGPFEGWYLHQFTGKRFVNADNSGALPAFSTGTLLASLRLGRRWQLGLQLDNCWNQAYQMVLYRPMPGRSWQLTGRYSFR